MQTPCYLFREKFQVLRLLESGKKLPISNLSFLDFRYQCLYSRKFWSASKAMLGLSFWLWNQLQSGAISKIKLWLYTNAHIIRLRWKNLTICIKVDLISLFIFCKITKGLLFYDSQPCELEYTWRENKIWIFIILKIQILFFPHICIVLKPYFHKITCLYLQNIGL